ALARERTERADLEQPDGVALAPQLVDDVLDGAAARAETDDRVPRGVERVRLDGAVAPARERLEVLRDLVEHLARILDRGELLMAELEVVVRHRERALRRRRADVEEGARDPVV